MKRLLTVAFLLASILTLTACGGEGTIQITGSVLLETPSTFQSNDEVCTGSGELSPVRAGAVITVDDAVSATLSV